MFGGGSIYRPIGTTWFSFLYLRIKQKKRKSKAKKKDKKCKKRKQKRVVTELFNGCKNSELWGKCCRDSRPETHALVNEVPALQMMRKKMMLALQRSKKTTNYFHSELACNHNQGLLVCEMGFNNKLACCIYHGHQFQCKDIQKTGLNELQQPRHWTYLGPDFAPGEAKAAAHKSRKNPS